MASSNYLKYNRALLLSPLVTDILATLMGFPFKTTYSICGQQKVTFIII